MSNALKPTVAMPQARAGQAGSRFSAEHINHARMRSAMRDALASTMASLALLQASRVVSKESLERPLSTI